MDKFEVTHAMDRAGFNICEIAPGTGGFATGTAARNAIYRAMHAVSPCQSRPLGVERERQYRALVTELLCGIMDVGGDAVVELHTACVRALAALTLTDASDEGREAVRREAFEEAARIVDIWEGKIVAQQIMREQVGAYARRAFTLAAAAIRARAVPPSDSSGDSA